MTTTGRVIVLAAVIGAGLIAGRLIGRVRRGGGFAEVDDKHVAILDATGRYVRCETLAGAVVADSICGGCGVWTIPGCPPADDETNR